MSLWDLLLQQHVQLVLFFLRKLEARASSPSGWEIYFTTPVYIGHFGEFESVLRPGEISSALRIPKLNVIRIALLVS